MKNGGFLQIIIFIIVALLIMKYFNITISEVVSWFKTFFWECVEVKFFYEK